MTDKRTLINIESTNTFEQWRTLTNSQTNVIKKAVTMGANSGDNIGDVTLKGSLTIAPGVFTDPVHNSLGHLNVNKIYAQTDVDPYIELGNNVEVVGDWIKLTSVNADEAVEIQFQNNGTDSWGISTNSNHTQLTIGDGSHGITFNSVDNSITSSDLTIHNAMLGTTIDGIIIGSNTATSATFTDVEGTTIEATTGFVGDIQGNVTGNLAGDIFASNGTEKILENGTNGANATFRGSILNDDGTEILSHGSTATTASFIGNVQGNLDGVADEATLAQNANKAKVVQVHSPHEDPVNGPQGGDHYVTFIDGVEDVAYSTARPTSHGENNTSYQNLEDHSKLRYNPEAETLKVPNVEAVEFKGPLTGNVTGDLTGNADKASYLDNTPTIGGVKFDGYKSIDLKGVNKAGDQNTSGKAATAGHADKAGHATTAGSATTASACTGNAATSSSTSGNASTASRLATARTIGGVSFNGTAAIDLPGVNKAGNQNTSGKAAKAGHADKAGHATTAGKANVATSAGSATTATKATKASHATTATKATNATNANISSFDRLVSASS
ncbi:hypothetical protein OAG36_00965 [bacterium]|nr:hypothetical protein [bacterium]